MRRLAEFVVQRRRFIIGTWIVLMIVGGALSQTTINRLTVDFSFPGQPSDAASHKVVETFGTAGQNSSPLVVAIHLPNGERVSDHTAEVQRAFAGISSVRVYDLPLQVFDSSTAQSLGKSADAFVTDDGRTALAYVFYPLQRTPTPEPPVAQVTAAVTPLLPAGASLALTSTEMLATSDGGGIGLGVLIELLIAGIGAMFVLAYVFGSFLAVLPLIIASVSIPGTLLVLLPLTYISDYSFIVQYLISLVGLGLGIDYSLLLVTRWREERHRGYDNHEAVRRAMASAGHAVVMSGLTVAIGLLSLVVLPVPFLRSIGIAGALIPLVTVLATITLTPAILAAVGPRLDWPRRRNESSTGRGWTKWASFMVRRRWLAVLASVAVLAALMLPFVSAKIGFSSARALAAAGPARDTLDTLTDQGVPIGVLSPIEVLTETSSASQVATKLTSIEGVDRVVVAKPSIATLNRPLSGTGPSVTMLFAIPHEQTVNQRTVGVVERVRDAVGPKDGVIGITGVGPAQTDFQHAVYDKFPLVLLVLSILIYLLLARAFRSLLLPLKAVVMNFMSLAAAIGATVLFWQYGVGSEPLYGINATGAIAVWIPPMIFAFLFGLSMDYEVFILARIREEYDKTGSTDQATVEGVGRTGRLVTGAALILFLAFVALSMGPGTDQKVLATGLGIGILLDATVIRSVLLPATVSLMGKWNWYMPTIMRRVLRVPDEPVRVPVTESVPAEVSIVN